jgi:thioesterase domain-containing protein
MHETTEPWKAGSSTGGSRDNAGIEHLEAYLHREIPLSGAMGVSVEAILDDRVVLAAPIEPNLNHKSTAFGGSLSAVAILAGWSLIHLRLEAMELDAELVIRRNEIAYLAPVRSRFLAEARLAEGAGWGGFERGIRRGRLARIEVNVSILADQRLCATLRGEFVGLPCASVVPHTPSPCAETTESRSR